MLLKRRRSQGEGIHSRKIMITIGTTWGCFRVNIDELKATSTLAYSPLRSPINHRIRGHSPTTRVTKFYLLIVSKLVLITPHVQRDPADNRFAPALWSLMIPSNLLSSRIGGFRRNF